MSENNDNGNELWSIILANLSQTLNKQSFDTWFKPTRVVSYLNKKLTLEVPSQFFIDWLKDHYMDKLKEFAKKTTNEEIIIEFTIAKDLQSKPLPDKNKISENKNNTIAYTTSSSNNKILKLNPKYTFNNFVIGNNNRFAQAASLAVAEAPAKAYNPLFIYGGVGLGKTHLLHAIGNYINNLTPDKKLVYVSSETFMNEMISSISSRTMKNFRERFRTVDVLLIDDIQFLAGKESTQEEFFHTFNDLYNMQKQIVATSDSHPKEINLEERLRSRFEWGLVADIQSPDFETRFAILSQMAENEKVIVPNDVLAYLSNQFKSNVRELEGSLTRVIAFSTLTKKEINIDLTKEVLRDIFSDDYRPITIELITEIVAKEFNITLSQLKSKKRTSNIVLPRQIAMYLAREMTDFSLPEIGRFFGGKDHTTVIYGFDKIKEKISQDKKMKDLVNYLTNKLKENPVN